MTTKAPRKPTKRTKKVAPRVRETQKTRNNRYKPSDFTEKPSETLANAPELQKPLPAYTEHELLASICKLSFADFLREFWHVVVPEKLVWNWHLQYLCDELQAMGERVFAGLPKLHDLIINISPGSSKSTIASIMFPVWCWIRMAACQVITASYQFDLASDLSRLSRDLVTSALFQKCFPEIRIRDDQNAKSFYVNTAGGWRYAIGVDGGVTGKHGHIIIVDDPLNPRQAASAADIKATNQWMEETLPSRKVDKLRTPTILIMQRLDENDPTGARLLKADRLPVKQICIPAELTEHVNPPELAENYIDGLMDPVRLSYAALEEAEAQGEFVYAAQYLQTPVPRGGAMFHVDKLVANIVNPPDKMVGIIRAWDKAGTQGDGTFTVGALIGIDHLRRFWILDIVRGQWDAARREAVIRETAERDGTRVPILVEQEPGSGGKDSAVGTIRTLAGFNAKLLKVGKSDGDKEARADPFAAQVNAGNVFMKPGRWNQQLVDEMRFFPKSRYKDQIDACSMGFNRVAVKKTRLGGVPSRHAA